MTAEQLPAAGHGRTRRALDHPARTPLAVTLLSIVALLAVTGFADRSSQRAVQREVQDQVRSNRDAAVRAVILQTDQAKRVVAAWAKRDDVIDGLRTRTPASRARLQGALESLSQANLESPVTFVASRDGRVVAIHPASPAVVNKDFSFRDWYRGVASADAPYVSSAYRSAGSGKPLVVAIAAPVRSGTRLQGYVVTTWRLASVSAVARGAAADDGVALTITDQRGHPLTGHVAVDPRGEAARSALDPVTAEVLDGRQVNRVVGDRLVSATRIDGLGWTVRAERPRQAALASAREFRRSLELVAVLGILVILALGGIASVVALRRARERHGNEAERRRLLALFASSPIGILEARPDGSLLAANEAASTLLAYPPDELTGGRIEDLIHPDDTAYSSDAESGETVERLFASGTGQAVPVLTSTVALTDEIGRPSRSVTFLVDLSQHKQAERDLRNLALQLATREQRFRRVFDAGLNGKLLADSSGVILRANAALAEQLGRPVEQLAGTSITALAVEPAVAVELAACVADPTSEYLKEIDVRHADGRTLRMIIALTWLDQDGPSPVLLAQLEDVTARRQAESRLTDLALHDELTGLPNRRLLLDRCETAFATARETRHPHSHHVGALFVDLDGFKPVNDTAGHEFGDHVLIDIAHSLRRAVRPTDTVSRVGGDEFVVLIPEADSTAELRDLADRVRAAVHRRVAVGGAALELSASVGVALADLQQEPALTPELLLRRADTAMYRAKDRGKNRHDVYDEELQADTEGRMELETAIRDGLRDDRLSAVFQAVVDVESGQVVGAEALMRLHDAGGRLLPTLPSVHAAESAGMVSSLTDRMLATALRAAQSWPDEITVAVNVSPRELSSTDLRERVEQALEVAAMPAYRLVLEITESSIVGAGDSALHDLDELRRLGVRVAIDDFGTAYATLANLTTLPVDILKVDGSFTAGLPHLQTHTAIVHGVASMAFELGIPCIVEGVENQVQYDALRGLGVQAQGWLWGQPTADLGVRRIGLVSTSRPVAPSPPRSGCERPT